MRSCSCHIRSAIVALCLGLSAVLPAFAQEAPAPVPATQAALSTTRSTSAPSAPNAGRIAPDLDEAREKAAPRVADAVEAERESLAMLAQELVYLREAVREAAERAPRAARVQFRYDWLERDLELVQRGIQDHLDAPRQPRPVPALKGDYRR